LMTNRVAIRWSRAAGQHGRGAAAEVVQRVAEHRVVCWYPGGVDVQADPAGQADVAGRLVVDFQPYQLVLPGRQHLGGQVLDGPIGRDGMPGGPAVPVDRGTYCQNGSVPKEIYAGACETQ
jgi:hypothetical protein